MEEEQESRKVTLSLLSMPDDYSCGSCDWGLLELLQVACKECIFTMLLLGIQFKLGTFHEPKLARPLTIIPFSTIHDSSLFDICSDKNNIALTKTESRIGHA